MCMQLEGEVQIWCGTSCPPREAICIGVPSASIRHFGHRAVHIEHQHFDVQSNVTRQEKVCHCG